jgi:Transketolase, pyrimidine binding domain
VAGNRAMNGTVQDKGSGQGLSQARRPEGPQDRARRHSQTRDHEHLGSDLHIYKVYAHRNADGPREHRRSRRGRDLCRIHQGRYLLGAVQRRLRHVPELGSHWRSSAARNLRWWRSTQTNSTGVEAFASRYPERFFESFIAEQNMVGVSLGLATSGKIPYATTFACLLTRAYDFIRMAQYSRPRHLVLSGSHAGVSIGEDGPSQMGLEDLAMVRGLIDSTILYPADAVSAERLTTAAARIYGIVYIRTTRPKTPVIYPIRRNFRSAAARYFAHRRTIGSP